jgi:hypothetical protein
LEQQKDVSKLQNMCLEYNDISQLMRVTYDVVTSTIPCGQGGHYTEGEGAKLKHVVSIVKEIWRDY